ncbi:polysaccharide pyruvyl transferase family protein [Naasia sp. SYSU D00948]|uniref:polysaccharide pyruvyl transferase family protein n=1 Tax=Naasia sp. SYSU D00948 TaxID=2817379 RepID=UPI001B30B6B1|nr:polysaccharide pyruvyl transferase family protein [Naasia sp. SYSU D00948]
MRTVFAIGRGQYENIGDIILRRQLLDWVRPMGPLHVYVGHSPDGYDEGLRLGPDDVVYRSLLRWYRAALSAALQGNAAYVFKPGEIQLTLVGMKEHLSMLPLLAALRARGGRAVRAGVGTRNYAPLPRALMRPSIALSDLTLWRDVTTASYMRTGQAMPDLAFAEGAGDEEIERFREHDPERNVLVVSMRADDHIRPYPSRQWLDGVRQYAASRGLEIWAVTQVHVDDERTRRLARDLGGRALTWEHLGDHAGQERRLRELYRRTAVALSDRLHVIIAAFTEGAVPVGSLVDGSDKVDRHFRTIGIDGVSVATRGLSADEFASAIGTLETQRPAMFERLLEARSRLGRHRADVQSVLASGPSGARRPAPEKVPATS